MVLVSLDDCSVHQLLQLHVVQVVPNHHLQNGEELSVGDVSIAVDVVDLEGESQLLLLARSSREGVKTLHKLEEGDASILILVKHCDHSLHQWVVGQF